MSIVTSSGTHIPPADRPSNAGNDRRMTILDWFAAQQIDCTLPQFYGSINSLLADGVIERVGEKRGTRYRLAQAEGSA